MNTLPNGKVISKAGFGCAAVWSKPWFNDKRAAEVIATCAEQGVTHFDTSPSYAIGERRLGAFLRDHDPSRFVVSTKVGTVRARRGKAVKDWSVAGMEASLTRSLATLGLEQVDILYLHNPPIAALNDDVLRFFDREKARGRIALSGVNSFDPEVIAAVAGLPVDAVMLQFNGADLSALPLLDRLAGKLIISGTALSQAIADPRGFVPVNLARAWYLLRALNRDPAFLVRGRRIAQAFKSNGVNAIADQIRLPASDPRVASVLFSTTNPLHAAENSRAAREPMPRSVWTRLLDDLAAAHHVATATRFQVLEAVQT